MLDKSWLCCQLGAREHYAIPRALHRSGALDRLITDAWISPSSLLAKVSDHGSTVRDRFESDLRDARVNAFNSSLIFFEALAKASRLRGWPLIMARNKWFQRKVVSYFSSSQLPDIGPQAMLFAYSYAALGIFRFAKSRGWKTVLGQIDGGPEEEKIVEAEAQAANSLQPKWAPAPKSYWNDWREECELADVVVVNSTWSSKCAAAVLPAIQGKLRIIPLALENSENGTKPPKTYPSRFTNDRRLRVLFLGQINARKGVARLLQAARELRNSPVEFFMVGPIQFQNIVNKDDVNIHWCGLISNQEIDEYFRKADVFILPTLSDGFALTQLEAISNRVPVIASRFCGDVVRDGIDGIILRELTPEAIKETIQRVIINPELLASLSQGTQFRKEFGLETLGEKLVTLA